MEDFLKKVLEGFSKFVIYIAPVLIGFFASIAYLALKKPVTKKEFLIRFTLSVALCTGVYEILKHVESLLPFAGVIVGVCSFFSIQIIEMLVLNFPDIMKTILKTLLKVSIKKIEENAKIKDEDVDTDN